MIFKQKTVLGFVLAVSICVVYADFGLTNPVKPISTGGDSQRAQDFQKIVEKHFTAGDRLLMPLGMYSVNFRGVSTKEVGGLVRNGVTFIQRYIGELTVERVNEDIVNATRAGMPMAFCMPTRHYYEDKQWWRKFIQDRDLINQKQIKIWYLHGEPKDKKGLSQLEDVAALLHETDDLQRPVISYHHSLDSTAKEMCRFLDALVSGIYPGLSKHRGLPRVRIAYRMDSIPKRYGTPAIAALESYNTPSGWPSPKEIKFDAYLALIHEAKGIMWYNYHQLRNKPELVNAVLAVARTLNGPEHLGEVFLKGKDNQDIQARILAGPTLQRSICL